MCLKLKSIFSVGSFAITMQASLPHRNQAAHTSLMCVQQQLKQMLIFFLYIRHLFASVLFSVCLVRVMTFAQRAQCFVHFFLFSNGKTRHPITVLIFITTFVFCVLQMSPNIASHFIIICFYFHFNVNHVYLNVLLFGSFFHFYFLYSV